MEITALGKLDHLFLYLHEKAVLCSFALVLCFDSLVQKKNIIQYKFITSSIYCSRPSIYQSNLSMNNVLQIFYCVFAYPMFTIKCLTKFCFYLFICDLCIYWRGDILYWFNGFLTIRLYHISLWAFTLLLNLTWFCLLLLLYDVISIEMVSERSYDCIIIC